MYMTNYDGSLEFGTQIYIFLCAHDITTVIQKCIDSYSVSIMMRECIHKML